MQLIWFWLIFLIMSSEHLAPGPDAQTKLNNEQQLDNVAYEL